MQISALGLCLIKQNEGFEPNVYLDTAGVETIGYGHKLETGDSFPNGITEPEAELLIESDLSLVELVLAQNAPPTCTQNQWDALCDFGYNLGAGSLKKMLAHGWDQVTEQIPRWVHVDGAVSEPLSKRRQAEVELFNTPC